ncbi:MAG: hypothetical protein ACE5RG_08875, partial [Candidatus Nitrosomaritimum yanchengensis]
MIDNIPPQVILYNTPSTLALSQGQPQTFGVSGGEGNFVIDIPQHDDVAVFNYEELVLGVAKIIDGPEYYQRDTKGD